MSLELQEEPCCSGKGSVVASCSEKQFCDELERSGLSMVMLSWRKTTDVWAAGGDRFSSLRASKICAARQRYAQISMGKTQFTMSAVSRCSYCGWYGLPRRRCCACWLVSVAGQCVKEPLEKSRKGHRKCTSGQSKCDRIFNKLNK